MTTRAQLAQAHLLNLELDQVTAALSALQQPGVTANTALEIVVVGPVGVNRDGSRSGQSVSVPFRVIVSPSTAAVTNLLTARQNALQNALIALGVT